MTDYHHQSYLRDDNHFVRMYHPWKTGERIWVLIDGSWYHYLAGISHNGTINPVAVMKAEPMALSMYRKTRTPVYKNFDYVEWGIIKWHPGNFVSPVNITARNKIHLQMLTDRWKKWQAKRKRIGFFLLPDGSIPPYVCNPEYKEENAEFMDDYCTVLNAWPK